MKKNVQPKANKIIVMNDLPKHVVADLNKSLTDKNQLETMQQEATRQYVTAHDNWVRFINSVIGMKGHDVKDTTYAVQIDVEKNEVKLTVQ